MAITSCWLLTVRMSLLIRSIYMQICGGCYLFQFVVQPQLIVHGYKNHFSLFLIDSLHNSLQQYCWAILQCLYLSWQILQVLFLFIDFADCVNSKDLHLSEKWLVRKSFLSSVQIIAWLIFHQFCRGKNIAHSLHSSPNYCSSLPFSAYLDKNQNKWWKSGEFCVSLGLTLTSLWDQHSRLSPFKLCQDKVAIYVRFLHMNLMVVKSKN